MNNRKYLIIYDISDNKRRRKVSKLLDKYGMRVQYSAFECELDRQQKNKLINQLEKLTKIEDSVRIYDLMENIYLVNKGERKLHYSDNLCII